MTGTLQTGNVGKDDLKGTALAGLAAHLDTAPMGPGNGLGQAESKSCP